jgi:dihydroflavonol-4-reductase
MRALVTGATGFVGSHLCRVLLEAGHEVRAFRRSSSRLIALGEIEVEHVVGDVHDLDSLRAAMRGVDWVFHTAGRVAHWRDGATLVSSIVDGTHNVLQAALEAGVRRVVFTSSTAALGVPLGGQTPGQGGELLDETHRFNYPPHRWPYGYAKVLAEEQAVAATREGLDCVIVNPSSIFGPGDLNIIGGALILEVAHRRVPAMLRGGMNVVHVADVAEGHLAAAERGRCGERYILGGHNMTHTESVKVVAAELGMRAPSLELPVPLVEPLAACVDVVNRFAQLPFNGDLLRLSRYYFYYDTSKARRELGLRDPRLFNQAIREGIEWYRQHGML